MCGIAGSIRFPIPKQKIETLLKHRGPDGCGHWIDNDVELWHSRLSIIDAEGGSQPMTQGSLVISYNGEIYNFKEIAEKYNLNCNTSSDTSVLLAFIEKFGINRLHELDGMFAAAIYNRETKELWLLRDRFGEKPLYFWNNQGHIFFCSELSALSKIVEPKINKDYFARYLKTGLHLGEETIFSEVQELPAGCVWKISTDTGELIKENWFSTFIYKNNSDIKNRKLTVNDTVDALENALIKSVETQLEASDLEVGTFLSGGIDSGLVTAIAAQHTQGLKSFTITFDGQFDESPLATATANRYKTDHRNISIDYSDLPDNIETIIRNYGEPFFDDSIIPSWYVSREAKKHVPVVLTGDGADELFGGYRRYVLFRYLNLIKEQTFLDKVLGTSKIILPKPQSKFSKYNFLWRLLDILEQDGLNRYLSSTTGHTIDSSDYQKDMLTLNRLYEKVMHNQHTSSLQKAQQLDLNILLTGTYLPKVDIASMAHSLESRCPFLSKHVIEVAESIPDHLKIKGLTTKYILRELGKRWLPEDVVSAPKRGFETPLQQWTTGILRPKIHQHLLDNHAPIYEFFDQSQTQELLRKTQKSITIRESKLIWNLFTSNVWLTGL